MKISKFMEEQIIGILREHEVGAKTTDLFRQHGISGATFYAWRAKFGSMAVSEAKQLKILEGEWGLCPKAASAARTTPSRNGYRRKRRWIKRRRGIRRQNYNTAAWWSAARRGPP